MTPQYFPPVCAKHGKRSSWNYQPWRVFPTNRSILKEDDVVTKIKTKICIFTNQILMEKSSGLGTFFSNSTHHASELPSSICWFCLGSIILNPLGVLTWSFQKNNYNFQPKYPWQIICHQLFCKVIGKLIVSSLCSGQATQACGIPGVLDLVNMKWKYFLKALRTWIASIS